ncbi:hypothetical protein [Microbacterium capsulatum]|uniref:Integral membrane protein n=1 Tax=Microbacterium capsulatum TaxID=3041921 RepID=A0ABU0XL28_9MICO|nr:hypothetical protein [Microbacterium sp. ASV81]MDQ4215860.1 hypothetical protein [Microbacterium sp. ASV81]
MKAFWTFLVIGVVLIAVGLIWTLQGLDVLGGSVMSGSPLWATIGPIVLVVGAVLVVVGVARRRRHQH